MSAPEAKGLPRNESGNFDKDAVEVLFMASPYLDWTRFAEEYGENPNVSRQHLPVKTWQDKKRKDLADRQLDTLRAMFDERKYKWTRDVLETLDKYPRNIDLAMDLAQAKMGQIADMYRDYLTFKEDPTRMFDEKKKRIFHPFEKLSLMDMGSLMRGMRELTEAKLKALMVDKWALNKLDIPKEDMNDASEVETNAPLITIEGKSQATFGDFQKWFDIYHDKPVLSEAKQTEANPSKTEQNSPNLGNSDD